MTTNFQKYRNKETGEIIEAKLRKLRGHYNYDVCVRNLESGGLSFINSNSFFHKYQEIKNGNDNDN